MPTPTNPKSISKRKHYAAIEAANLAALDQLNNANLQLQQAKPKRWVTIALEVLRIIIAALAGSTGASVL